MTLFDYNPEPDSLGKEDEYTLQSGQAISKTVTLKVPTGSLSAKLVQEALATDGKQSQIYSIVLY